MDSHHLPRIRGAVARTGDGGKRSSNHAERKGGAPGRGYGSNVIGSRFPITETPLGAPLSSSTKLVTIV